MIENRATRLVIMGYVTNQMTLPVVYHLNKDLGKFVWVCVTD